MNPNEKRTRALSMLRATFIRAAAKDDTIIERRLLAEITEKFGVSLRTAKEYINEIVEMGLIIRQDGFLFHSNESEIRKDYKIEEIGE